MKAKTLLWCRLLHGGEHLGSVHPGEVEVEENEVGPWARGFKEGEGFGAGLDVVEVERERAGRESFLGEQYIALIILD